MNERERAWYPSLHINSCFPLPTSQVNGTVSFFMVLALLFCYLCASAAFAYCLSQPFTKPSTAAPAAFLAYMGLLVAFLILGIKQVSTQTLGEPQLEVMLVKPLP